MTPSVSLLNANDITIGNEGRLHFMGAGIKVHCRTVNGPGHHDVIVLAPIGWAAELALNTGVMS
jgi:hypothetical protein